MPAIAEYPPLAGFELVNFFGLFGPAGLPGTVLGRVHGAAVKAMQMPDVAAKFKGMGFEPAPNAPEEFRQFIRGESAKFAQIIRDAGVKLSE
ncbi:MAG: tripartite tricarboxylate transporter substrate-binding protein [Methanocella sp.]